MDVKIDRQTPLGFFNLAISYGDAADFLTRSVQDGSLHLSFEHPIKAHYCQAWELAMKACLMEQGFLPEQLKRKFGHDLSKMWDHVDKEKFKLFKLHSGTKTFVDRISPYHKNREYAYTMTGFRLEHSLTYMRSGFGRFRISRKEIINQFSAHLSKLNTGVTASAYRHKCS